MIDPGHSLSIDGMFLVEDGHPVVHEEGFITDVSADGTNWGNPEPAVTTLLTALRDGDVETTFRYGNRQPVIFVLIEAPNGPALAAGEAALAKKIGRRLELVWQPPDVAAAPTVYDIVNSRMDFEFDDQGELRRERVYRVTFAALPYGRSKDKITTPALAPDPVSPTTVNINDCTTLTGWTPFWDVGTMAVAMYSGIWAGSVGFEVLAYSNGAHLFTSDLSGLSVDFSATPYLVVDWYPGSPGTPQWELNLRGGYTKVREQAYSVGAPSWGRRTWWVKNGPPTTVTHLNFEHYAANLTDSEISQFGIFNIARSDTVGASATRRDLTRNLTPGGSVPADGDVIVEHATADLSKCLVYSGPADRVGSISLRQFRIAGPTETTDSGKVSGAYNDLSDSVWDVYDIPVAACPRGDVHLWFKLGDNVLAGNVLFDWKAEVYQNAVLQAGSGQTGQTLVDVPLGSGYRWFRPLARLTLPPGDVRGANAKVRISFKKASGYTGNTPRMDEAWLFAMDEGRLTVLDAGTGALASGSVANRLKISAPSLAEPHGSILLATAADFSDAWSPNPALVECHQVSHVFSPAGSQIRFVSHVAQNALVSFRHYPRWHTHAGY
jgi:hypothetical protein